MIMDVKCLRWFLTGVSMTMCVCPQPAVCARDLCVFSFQTLGVMSDAAEDIATQPEVSHLVCLQAVSINKDKFLHGAVSSPQDCSNRFTL